MQKFKSFLIFIGLMFLMIAYGRSNPAYKPLQQVYQILVYHYVSADQEKMIDQYLEAVVVPALHKSGNKNIGVFAPVTNDTATDKRIYVFITLTSPAQVWDFSGIQGNGSGLGTGTAPKDGFASTTYWQSDYEHPPYGRYESMLVKAWKRAPMLNLPKLKSPKSEHIYELRSYESASERYYWNKVHMFTEGGEIALFARLNFNAVFYGDVVSGPRMPNLMYMTSFENMDDRNAHWKSFSDDPEWKILSGKPEYQHNVSKADIILMRAKAYSDF